MRISGIKTCDISNGPGLRVSLWVQGCPFRCEGCHNKETWPMEGGREFESKDYNYLMQELSKGQNLSILGGEPMLYPQELTELLEESKSKFKELNVWLWTGYTWDKIKDYSIMKHLDVIVTEKFDKSDLANYELSLNRNDLYRGSRNQLVIDVQKSLQAGKIVEYHED